MTNRKLSGEQVEKILLEFGRSKSLDELAKEFGCSQALVKSWAYRMRKKGANIPLLNRGYHIDSLIGKLEEKHPELFKKPS